MVAKGLIDLKLCANQAYAFLGFMKTKKQVSPSCHCGCGGTTKGGRYLPGHDAKHKKALVEAALGGGKRAANKLEKLGWSKFLEAKLAKANPTRETAE